MTKEITVNAIYADVDAGDCVSRLLDEMSETK